MNIYKDYVEKNEKELNLATAIKKEDVRGFFFLGERFNKYDDVCASIRDCFLSKEKVPTFVEVFTSTFGMLDKRHKVIIPKEDIVREEYE